MPALFAAFCVLRRDDRFGMLEAEILQIVANPGGAFVGLGTFSHRDHRRPVEAVSGGEQLLFDGGEILRADQLVRLVEDEARPVAADLVEPSTDQILDGVVIGVDDRRRGLVAVFVVVDIEFGHDFLPDVAVAALAACLHRAFRAALMLHKVW